MDYVDHALKMFPDSIYLLCSKAILLGIKVQNPQALAIDYQRQPPMFRVSDTHYAATWLLDPRAPKLAPLPEGEEHYV